MTRTPASRHDDLEEFALGDPPVISPGVRRRHPRPLPWLAAAASLIVAGTATAAPPEPDLSGGIPWNVLDLELQVEPEVMWEWTPPQESLRLTAVLDDVLVVATGPWDPGWPRELTGLDMTTGEVRWSVEPAPRACHRGDHALTCVDDRGEARSAVVTIDAEGARPDVVRHPYTLSAARLDDGDLVLVEGGTSGLADLVRLDHDGEEVWRAPLSFSVLSGVGRSEIEIGEHLVATSSGSFDLSTGVAVQRPRQETAADGAVRMLLPDGTTRVISPDGVEIAIAEDAVWLPFDDAFGGPVDLLVDDAGVTTALAADADVSWSSRPSDNCWFAGRLDGILLQLCLASNGSSTHAFDQATGDRIWTRNEAGGLIDLDLAAGDSLLVTSSGAVSGMDLSTGRIRWTMPMPGSFAEVGTVGGALFAWSDKVLLRLG